MCIHNPTQCIYTNINHHPFSGYIDTVYYMIDICPFLSISKNMSVYFKCPIFLDICVDVGFLDHKQIH